MILGLVLLFSVALTLTIVGIAGHEEAGMMGVCWNEDGSVTYEVDYIDARFAPHPSIRATLTEFFQTLI